MNIGKEGLGVLLDLRDVETIAGILAVGDHTSLEGALEAANAGANLVALGVGEGDTARC